MRVRLLGDDHPLTIMTGISLAYARFNAGDVGAGEREALAAVDRARAALPPDHPLTSCAEAIAGEVLLGGGRAAATEPHLREAVRIRRGFLSPDHYRILGEDRHEKTVAARRRLADYRRASGRPESIGDPVETAKAPR